MFVACTTSSTFHKVESPLREPKEPEVIEEERREEGATHERHKHERQSDDRREVYRGEHVYRTEHAA